MIQLPDFDKSFEYENNFYLSADASRFAKLAAHYEIFKMTLDIPGAIVECGVFKGASLSRFAAFRDLFCTPFSKKIIGFDIFGEFPTTGFDADQKHRDRFITHSGTQGIGKDQLLEVFKRKNVTNLELVQGDVTKTVPAYLKEHPELTISLLNMDTDVYEPAVTILNHLYPRLVSGGVILLDDYGIFPGETKAVEDYFRGKNVEIRKFPFAQTPCYLVKKD